MAHKDRKINKKRGSRTCGFGNTQKHRGAGSRGGRGMAGSKKHKWSYVSKYLPDYFGGRGFKRPRAVIRNTRTINIKDIEENIDRFIKEGIVKKKTNNYYINLKEMGYDKLLGSGKPGHKFIINVDYCSESAMKKIKEAGGRVNITKLKESETE